jgi:ClpP class serine protease
MEQVRNFIDLVAQGQNAEAKESLDELLSARAFEALDAKKQEIGSTLFGGQAETTEEQPTE